MPVARFQLPDGRVARFEVPEGTTPEQAQSLIQSQLANLTPTQPSLPALPASLQPRPAAPQEAPQQASGLSKGQQMYVAGRDLFGPTVEALGAAGGAVLGGGAGLMGGGPVGAAVGGVSGAGLGYGIAKNLIKQADVLAGVSKPETLGESAERSVKDVIEGATMETGGRIVAPVLAKGIGKVMDLKNAPKQKAADLARASVGEDVTQAVNALRNAKPGQSVAEVTAGIQNPTWQALVRESLERSPTGVQYLNKFAKMNDQEAANALTKLAGGSTAAEARGAVEQMKQNLNSLTTPQRETALNRANLGKAVADYESQAGKLSEAAAAEVQKVRDLISAGNSAEAWARLQLIKQGKPVGLTKYTYPGELAEKAFGEWSSKAADASLDLGQGARFAQSAADALRSSGIKPLEGETLARSVASVTKNPEFAGNDLLAGAAKNVADDIVKWTNGGGVIDARALDAIRKNSVNAAIQQLRPGADATTQRNLAAGVLSKIKPVIDDAIEASGGEGYKQYLADYAKGMQRVNEKKLTGEALRLWKTDKDAFVRLVQNESPETVEKFLGKGNYNIATELADDTLSVLQQRADKHLTQLAADKQASEGQKALTSLIRQNSPKFRLPSWLSFWGAAANKTISELEKVVGDRSMKVLAEAMQSPEGAANLLETLPAVERNRVLQLISDPSQWSKRGSIPATAARGAGVSISNALSPEQQNQNTLSIELRGMANKE